jgi:hypothetical protein
VTSEVKTPVNFLSDARIAVQNVRRALTTAFASVDADPTQPRALARHLGVDKNLAWRLSRILVDDDPIAATPLLPGRAGQQALLGALKKKETSPQIVEDVRKSLKDFESMVVTHAGDRETFGMMLSELTDKGRADRDETHRRQAFLGLSAMWGVQARVRLSAVVITPGNNPNFLDVASVSGLLDFRRLRSNQPWTVASFGVVDNDGSPLSTGRITPLDPRVQERGDPPFLLDYCSESLPQMHLTSSGGGTMLLQAVDGPVGNSGLFNCLTGFLMTDLVPRWWQPPSPENAEFSVMLTTPSETLLFDLFIHQSLSPAMNPEIISFGALPGDSLRISDGPKRRMLPLVEGIIDLGANPPDLTAYEMPTYSQMMEWIFKRISRDASEFRGFRFRQRYPLIPTKVAYSYRLPEKP